MQKLVINAGSRAGGEAKKRGSAEKRGKKREKEVQAEFSGTAEQVVGQEAPGMNSDDPDGDPLKVPEGAKGRPGDIVPDPHCRGAESFARV
jgi:hypothetical protein